VKGQGGNGGFLDGERNQQLLGSRMERAAVRLDWLNFWRVLSQCGLLQMLNPIIKHGYAYLEACAVSVSTPPSSLPTDHTMPLPVLVFVVIAGCCDRRLRSACCSPAQQ
jgi:hypothetical protein